MTTGTTDKIAQFLKLGKRATNIQGVFLLKLPASKQNPQSLAIEINPPTNTAAGSAFTRKKGIIIRDGSELEQYNQMLSNPKVVELAKKIEDTAKGSSNINEEVFEI